MSTESAHPRAALADAVEKDQSSRHALDRSKIWTVAAAFAVLGGIIVLQRLHTYAEPLDRDVGTYVVIAQAMRHGRELYTDLFDHRPPLVFVLYALAQALVGVGAPSVFLLSVAAAVATGLALYAAAGSEWPVGLWAAAFWALICADLPLQANQPNTEVFMNVALAAAFAFLLRVGPQAADPRALAAGACLAAAALLKPSVLPITACLALAHLVMPAAGSSRRAALVQAVPILAVTGAAIAVLLSYFAAAGRGTDALNALVVYNQHYAGSILSNLYEGMRPVRLYPSFLGHTLPLLVVAAAAAALVLRRPSRRAVLLGAWLVGTAISVALPGKFYPHYYQLWLPPLCLAAAWSARALGRWLHRPQAGHALAAAAAVALAANQWPEFRRPPDEWSRAKYGDVFVRSRNLGTELAGMLGPGESLFQWGNEPELYVYTDRLPPTGMMWAQDVQYGPLRVPFRMRMLAQLSVADPDLIVVSRGQPLPTGALGSWFVERYQRHPYIRRRRGFTLWVRRGGPLERRILSARPDLSALR
jgi:4-amino-4-deoxy-L-arabinose transferase-like glycosyltransferase